MFVLTDFSTSTEFTFWNYKAIKSFFKSYQKIIHFPNKTESFWYICLWAYYFCFRARRTRSFPLPEKNKKNREILKIWKVLQERNLLPNRDWKIKNSEEKEEEKLYHNLKVYANFRGW